MDNLWIYIGIAAYMFVLFLASRVGKFFNKLDDQTHEMMRRKHG